MEDSTGALAEILTVVRERRGLDFSAYRSATVERRLENRMISVSAATHAAYLELLRGDPGEVDALIDRLTIKVSRFFRKASVFAALSQVVLPDLARRSGRGPVRIWSAGCGRGEEPHSLAMLLADPALETALAGASVCATDIDPQALAAVADAVYPPAALEEVPAAVVARSFEAPRGDGGRRVRDAVRARVRTLRHDLTAAASPPEPAPFHLIACRNVLIYLRPESQLRVERLLCHALAPGGYLLLGEAEWPCAELASDLDVIDRSARLFRLKAAAGEGREP